MMDKLDIFELPMDAKIQTTIEELQMLYHQAEHNGMTLCRAFSINDNKTIDDINAAPVIVNGDIV